MGDLTASLSAFMATWITPSSLFIFINLVILTIAITSRFATPKKIHHRDSPQLVRSSSLLDRVIPFNLGLYKYEPTYAETQRVEPVEKPDSPQLVQAPSLLERVKSFNLGLCKTECSRPENETPSPSPCPNPDIWPQPQLARAPSLLERLKSMKFYRSESIKEEKKSENPVNEWGHGLGHLGERCRSEKGVESPAEMNTWRSAKTTRGEEEKEEEEEEGVDARADDFINRFRQQLRLQRLDSILRYRQMLKGN